MAEQFNVTPEEKALLEERAKRRLVLRNEFLKKVSDPFRHGTHEGGAVFDPAIQRFMAMRVNTYEHFRPNLKNLGIGLALLAPMFAYGYYLKKIRHNREAKYRSGEVAYKDRLFKLI